jgi:hypothetical protein
MKNCLTAVHYIFKGLLPTIEDPIREVFTHFLDNLVDHHFKTMTWEDSVVIALINLFADSVHVFKD